MTAHIRDCLKLISILLITTLFSGCSSIQYYGQSIQGQLEVLQKRRPIEDILLQDDISSQFRNKLNTILKLRQFSIEELNLPENDSYLSYADLEREHVIWNIFANEEFSLEPQSWCYLIVGCLSYRGYFSKTKAEQHALQLKEQSYDVYLGGVSAYSTLGWFDDPVLNTMLRWSETYLATVMFHELAHQQLYIKDDTEFNESYADAVAHIGVMKWLEQQRNQDKIQKYLQSQQQEKAFVTLVLRYKLLLDELYNSSMDIAIKRKQKQILLIKLVTEYDELAKKWDKDPYKDWLTHDLNNAKLASIVTYRKYVPAFLDIYKKLEKDLNQFYSFSKSLSNCKPMKRKEILESRKIEFEC
jgi:predicted aminopeptidase